MSEMYVVCEKSFEYDDNFYYPPESGGGKPLKVFASEKAAIRAAKEMNFRRFVAEMNRNNLSSYGEGISDRFTERGIELMLEHGVIKKAGGGHKPYYEFVWGINAMSIPPEALSEICENFTLEFYEVYTVVSE